ncbi:CD9 antigen-like isoform X5 [Oncorhynchus mykiss]|uniref:CD9 antigen-like isoform X5 n=1 Tax=Oncorhynchus mykiss TaxID=8022 RepID=UPI001877F53C|nr:CD9 antigen-like isoform X5 [Oncorhynchus mykiss]
MAQVNRCLKQLFFGFNMLLGIAGCVLLVLGMIAAPHNTEHDQGESIGLTWIISTAVVSVLLSLLGAYGAYQENIVILRLFLGIIGFGSILFLILGFKVARSMPEAMQVIQENLPAITSEMMADAEQRQTIMALQVQGKCCGIMSYRDWDSNIPETCQCSSFKSDPSQCMEVQMTKDGGNWGRSDKSEMMWIYREPCGPLILDNFDSAFKTVLGFFLGFVYWASVIRRDDSSGQEGAVY